MSYREVAQNIERLLKLRRPIVAIAYVKGDPQDLKPVEAAPPSSCTFWALAQLSSFKTYREHHLNCSIGSVTHGIRSAEEVRPGCGCADIDFLVECEWITEEELRRMPSVKFSGGTICYGPLRQIEFEPDLILMFCNAEQSMYVSSALPVKPKTVGRPSCVGVPVALNEKVPVMSLGCNPSRLRAGYGPDELVVFIPGEMIRPFHDNLLRIIEIEDKVAVAVLQGRG
ncbi:MAG: DUF169 domain-containing protein [Thaumarchaeota archaeon]|nr:DUF169 domain-containing protein [Candidatus Calditenuaceae archaeon]MDW8042124.1 DUF169 domain-containing protein [Nitrososphaerota archaeon]